MVAADSDDLTLSQFRDRRRFAAENGRPGAGAKRSGRDGESLRIHVPPGTTIREAGELLADLDRFGAEVVVARGGRGGRGNARFATSTRQAPRLGELGEPGERRRLHLELKLIADVGLVGLPNAGKSTLLAALTGAHPKIGVYPFTTLRPNLGVAELESGRSVVLADVPGLIEGAHRGAGLGLAFLRHIERTRTLIHVVDASAGVDAAGAAVRTIEDELRAHSARLAERPRILAFNKIDVPGAAETAAALQRVHAGSYAISAATGEGCSALLEAAATRALPGAVDAAAALEPADARRHRMYVRRPSRGVPTIIREDEVYRVISSELERVVQMTDLDSDEAVARLQQRMRKMGVDAALKAAGCAHGDTVRIGAAEFTYIDDAHEA